MDRLGLLPVQGVASRGCGVESKRGPWSVFHVSMVYIALLSAMVTAPTPSGEEGDLHISATARV